MSWVVRARQPIFYYRDTDGGYLAVNYGILDYCYGDVVYESRTIAIAGDPLSVSTSSVSARYLSKCKRVARRNVPQEWINAIGLH